MRDESRPGALQYDGTPTTALARRAVRLLAFLTFLTLLNTVMMGVFVLGPQLSPYLKQQWQQWQATRAERKQRLADLAVQKQCLDYSAPPDKVVYEEDPDEGAKLLSADGADYEPAVSASIRAGFAGGSGADGAPSGWRPPVRTKVPQPLRQFQQANGSAGRGGGGGFGSFGGGGFARLALNDDAGAVLFLHERTSPAGKRRLVMVRLRYSTGFRGGVDRSGQETVLQSSRRTLVTTVYSAPRGADDPAPSRQYEQELQLLLPGATNHAVARVRREWVEGTAPQGVEQFAGGYERRTTTFDYGSRLRVLAGSADVADPSHFTIPYRVGPAEGVIDGWLREDGVRLQPRAGSLTFDGTEPAWDLSATVAATAPATAAPATAPSAPPRN